MARQSHSELCNASPLICARARAREREIERKKPPRAVSHPDETQVDRVPTGLAAHVDLEEARGTRFEAERVRPWRVVPWGVRLARLGLLPPEAVEWCERYARDCEATERITAGIGDGARSLPGPRSPSDRVLAAAERVRAIHARLHPAQVTLLESALVENHRICDVAIICGMRPRDDETMSAFSGRVCARVQARVAGVIALAMGSAGRA